MSLHAFLSNITSSISEIEKVRNLEEVPGYLSWQEGYTLLSLATHWPTDGDVVEVGSFMGRSTCFLACGCANAGKGKVIAVDHFKGSPEHQKGGLHEMPVVVETGSTYPAFIEYINRKGLSNFVTPIVGDSHEIGKKWDGKARMLFIDGDHSYAGTSGDFEAWSPHVVPNGLICFHDYHNAHFMDGVTKFIDEEISNRPDMKFIYRTNTLMAFVKM
jgi:hypothetical protein